LPLGVVAEPPAGAEPRSSLWGGVRLGGYGRTVRVSVLVDAYNLYYAGRKLCGRGVAGWRWLDVRSLASALVAEQAVLWPGARVERVVYCTARISGAANPSGAADQDVYIKALLATGSVDHVEYGNYISKVIKRPLATEDKHHKPVIVRPDWPVTVQHAGVSMPDATFMASVATYEEKGSDVNVAAHLLVDVLAGGFDAAVVISNDSDLRWPVQEARRRVPVGMVNPGSGFTAGHLSGKPGAGAGGHWWRTLRAGDFTAHQLPDPAGRHHRPVGW
jgi:hypothetical protein